RRDRVRQSGADGALARHIGALPALLQCGADDDVVDLARIDDGAPHRLRDRMAGERLRLGIVEGAAIGPADRRAGGGDDDGAAHEVLLLWAIRRWLSKGPI